MGGTSAYASATVGAAFARCRRILRVNNFTSLKKNDLHPKTKQFPSKNVGAALKRLAGENGSSCLHFCGLVNFPLSFFSGRAISQVTVH